MGSSSKPKAQRSCAVTKWLIVGQPSSGGSASSWQPSVPKQPRSPKTPSGSSETSTGFDSSRSRARTSATEKASIAGLGGPVFLGFEQIHRRILGQVEHLGRGLTGKLFDRP